MSKRRVRAIFQKELREYRRNGFIVWTMAVIPLVFVIFPLVEILAQPASAATSFLIGDPLAFLLGIPAVAPAVVAAYSVVGERQQGTLEPVLTTPIPREEFLLGKALAALVPSLGVSFAVYAFFIACVDLFASPAVASAVLQGPDLLAQMAFTPLLAGWSIWVGIHLQPVERLPRRPAVRHPGKSSAPGGGVPHHVQRDPRDARPRPRPRGGAAACRRIRLVDRVPNVRPRAPHGGGQIVNCWALTLTSQRSATPVRVM